MSRARKPADGGVKAPVKPKASAADAALASQSGTVTIEAASEVAPITAGPETSPAEGSQPVAPEGAQSSGADACAVAAAGLDAALDALRPAWLAVLEAAHGATATDRQCLREIVSSIIVEAAAFQGGLDHDIQAFLVDDDEDIDLVEIEVRSRDGKAFRRSGFDWSADYRTVHVTIDVAERLAADPNLLVKNLLVKEDAGE